MKTLKKGAINWIAKNETRITEYTKKAEIALVKNDYFECFRCVAKIHKFKDIIRMLKHEKQHNVTFNDVWNTWNANQLAYGTKEEYAIWNEQNFNIIINL
jgi:hypothetical protein